jgi:hypothetical protein
MGEKSGGLCDVDLDCAEALVLWKHFLPDTPSQYGRDGKPKSHHLYRCDLVDPKASILFKDANLKVVIGVFRIDPLEFPTKFEMVVNPKTAKALGLAVPPS